MAACGTESSRKAFARILDLHNQRLRGACISHTRTRFLGIVLAAVLDGVEQQFAKGRCDIFAHSRRQVGFQFADEMGGAVASFHLAANVQRNPLRAGGKHQDVVLPRGGVQRLLHNVA
jgi:hypothetical protein